MKGYYENQDATDAVLREGWLHTGDLGRLDEDGNLFIVGRKKEMILGTSGENVYPDELEEVYRDTMYIKELSVVGLPHGDGGETVAMLVVPDYEYDEDMPRERVRERVRDHVRDISKTLPLYKRAKVVHLWDYDLPKTSTRKVKRREVVAELERLDRASKGATAAVKEAQSSGGASGSWVRDVIAQVAQKKRATVTPESRLDELGFDSLMFTELGVAIEAAGIELPDQGELSSFETVADVESYIERHGGAKPAKGRSNAVDDDDDSDDIHVPAPLVTAGRRVLAFGQRMTYKRLLRTDVFGSTFVPPFGGYIVAANHASHLDMGLVKHALGEYGDELVALAAKDYFFEDPVRRMYFENFTNLVPMERYGSLRESLRIAGDVVRQGDILLIFPEGTRSTTGVMVDFKASLGYLAMNNKCGILPMYLAGTHDALPKGSYLPKQREISCHIGPFIDYPQLVEMTEGATRAETYRRIATNVERVVRKLCPEDLEWTLGDSGRTPVAEWEEQGGDAESEADSAPSAAPSSTPDTEVRS
jgi:long-chain acyl-CoA synthetase